MCHDSFGCHLADIDVMSQILREEFVEIYSQNFMEDLYEQVEDQCSAKVFSKIEPPPNLGQLDIQAVLESEFFFG
tara:strand:+ start:188 stop:412 length:225 start_codon:yes stop_codon:yes gene_type:complete